MRYYHRLLRNKKNWSPFDGFATSIDENGIFEIPDHIPDGPAIQVALEKLIVGAEEGSFANKDGRFIFKETEEGYVKPTAKKHSSGVPIEVAKLEMKIEELTKQLEEAKASSGSGSSEEVAELKQKVEKLTSANLQLQQSYDSKEAEITAFKKQVEDLTAERDLYKEENAKLVSEKTGNDTSAALTGKAGNESESTKEKAKK